MDNYYEENPIVLDYNTEREKLAMPEYGRNVLKMVEGLKDIQDRAKRSEQARAVVRVMEILNPQVHLEDNWEHKLWDHLYIMAGYDLDVDKLVYGEILMNWPMQVLCKEDCKGICSHCGKDLNEGPCSCEQESPDPRMAAIRDIFSKFKEV